MKLTTLAVAVSACIALPVLAQTPDAVTPKGVKPAMTLTGSGPLGYECKNTDGKFAWAGPVPNAKLTDKAGKEVGKYVAGPKWELADGSTVTGKQVATAPAAAGSIPLQLVDASGGTKQFDGVVNIQRINTKGGVAPSDACDAKSVGTKKEVGYTADYVFFKK
jgi:hypothetical protein